MSIRKSYRVFSEKNTSVEMDIPIIQEGELNQRVKASGTIIIPTVINDPKALVLTAKTASGAPPLRAWHTTMSLVCATNAAVSTALTISASSPAAKVDQLALVGRKLYRFRGGLVTQASIASATIMASNTYWERLTDFGSNAQRYLVVTPLSVSAQANAGFAYRVYGYKI